MRCACNTRLQSPRQGTDASFSLLRRGPSPASKGPSKRTHAPTRGLNTNSLSWCGAWGRRFPRRPKRLRTMGSMASSGTNCTRQPPQPSTFLSPQENMGAPYLHVGLAVCVTPGIWQNLCQVRPNPRKCSAGPTNPHKGTGPTNPHKGMYNPGLAHALRALAFSSGLPVSSCTEVIRKHGPPRRGSLQPAYA